MTRAARALPRSHVWLRALMLLLALLVPGAHAEPPTAPAVAMEGIGYDGPEDAALRPPAQVSAVTPRPSPLPRPTSGDTAPASRAAPLPPSSSSSPKPPHARLPALRCVVLRC
ncbi:hypothetical protein [Streptomyces sp. NPDC006739]|uniref:hypothetical protein n=1 Tax=Streptomyces sp. NPDC006739 TaxID=3364763 RepID=UPI0036A6CE3B